MYLDSLGNISKVKYVINCDTAILVFPSPTDQSMKCSIQNLNKSIKRIWNDPYRPGVWSRMQEVLARPFISMTVMENSKTPSAERKSIIPGNGKHWWEDNVQSVSTWESLGNAWSGLPWCLVQFLLRRAAGWWFLNFLFFFNAICTMPENI